MPDRERPGQAGHPHGAQPYVEVRHPALRRGPRHRLHAPRRGARGPHHRRGAGHAGHQRPAVPRREELLPRAGAPLPVHHHGGAEHQRAPDQRGARPARAGALRPRLHPGQAVRAELPHLVAVVLPGEQRADRGAVPSGHRAGGLHRRRARHRRVLRHGHHRPGGGLHGRGAGHGRGLRGILHPRCAAECAPQRRGQRALRGGRRRCVHARYGGAGRGGRARGHRRGGSSARAAHGPAARRLYRGVFARRGAAGARAHRLHLVQSGNTSS